MTTKLKIKDTLYVLRDSEDNYVFISTATRRIKKFQVDYLVKDIIRSLDSEQTEQDLTERLSSKYNSSDIDNCLNALEQKEFLEDMKQI